MKKLLFILLASAIVTGCKEKAKEKAHDDVVVENITLQAPRMAAMSIAEDADYDSSPPPEVTIEQKIIKNANISYETTEVEQGATVSYGAKMGNAFKSGINTLSSFFIGLIYFWPFILIFVIAYILIRRRIKRKRI